MKHRKQQRPAWSRGGAAMAAAIVAQAVLGWISAIRAIRIDGASVALGSAIAVGSVIVLTRCRVPSAAKAALVVLGCGSLLSVVATQDLLGLRKVERSTATALMDANIAAGQPIRTRTVAASTITAPDPAGQPAARVLASDIDRRLAASHADVSMAATLTAGPAGQRISWALVRGHERLWCGLHTEEQGATDFDALTDRVVAAARRSRGAALDFA